MVNIVIFIVSAVLAYALFSFFNDPIKDLTRKKHRLPKVKIKNVEFLPYFRIHIRQRTFHIHHWVTLTIITGISIWGSDSLNHFMMLKAAGFAGIIQGLRYPDRFKFWYPREKEHRD